MNDIFQQMANFVRDYTEGVRARDLKRLFERDAGEAWNVLRRGREETESEDPASRILDRVRVVFLGLSFLLSPPRRLLFAISLLCLFLGLFELLIEGSGGARDLGGTLWMLAASAGLLFLLSLELVDRVRVRDELEIARQLQRDLMPEELPIVHGWSSAHSATTAAMVGGDHYDMVPLEDGRLALVAGDASGHGMAAGLVMAIANSALRLAIDIDPSPKAVVDLVNRALYRTGTRRAFMTLVYGVLDPADGRLELICAGHPFPIIRRADGTIEELGKGGLPLGVRPELELEICEATIGIGDLLMLYSDGLPEALREDGGPPFGFDTVSKLVAPGGSAEEVHRRLLRSLDAFLDGDNCPDDVTLMILKRIEIPPLVPQAAECELGAPN